LKRIEGREVFEVKRRMKGRERKIDILGMAYG
jgi:hypothetical protein